MIKERRKFPDKWIEAMIDLGMTINGDIIIKNTQYSPNIWLTKSAAEDLLDVLERQGAFSDKHKRKRRSDKKAS